MTMLMSPDCPEQMSPWKNSFNNQIELIEQLSGPLHPAQSLKEMMPIEDRSG